MIILALDLGKFNTMCCVFNTKTRKHEFINAATDRNYLTTLLKKTKCDLVVMEACGPCGWINDLAISLGHKTLVCSTNEDAWKWSNVKRKTDKDDALKLARMASMGELKPVHMPSVQHREFRSLVKYRKTLDNRITKMKCTIRAWFVNQGNSIDSGEKAWNTGRVHINSFRKPLAECSPNELWKAELDIELTQLDTLSTHLELITKKLDAIYERISGKQKTRKKKAAIALARKIVIIAWAMLRDEKDWDPRTMIQTTESFGRMPLGLKEILQTMKPKELSQQRKNRLAREVREAKAAADSSKKDEPTPKKDANEMNSQKPASRKRTNDEQPNRAKKSHTKQSTESMNLRGARKRVPVRDA